MKDRALRAILILFLIAALGAGGVYAAARYGTPDDPLVTLSYLTDVAEKEITDRTDEQIQSAVAGAQSQIQSQIRDAAGVFVSVNLTAGQILRCDAGTEIVLTSGSASASGAFTDSTAGEPLASGGSVAANHLYLASASGASIQAQEGAALLVRGAYTVG